LQQATADINEQADYYLENAGLTIALRFIDNAERAFNELLARPGLGALLGLPTKTFAAGRSKDSAN
jgi:plasmid stabilization system protein ParE